ncbi:protein inscuteable homolog isoform X2 [Prorops nasuta]|uniref:protein inscuteable homolog isoform X2 n=1 Tax=Prorops nasuta TaxID=863751 RepID=UPI0034CF836F
MSRRQLLALQLCCESLFRNVRYYTSSWLIAGSECIECLGDFLYATEPPEDPEEEPRSLRSESSSSNSIQLDFRGKTSATRAWLCELVERTESECCITLQSKSLPSRRKSDAEREAAAATGDTCNLSSIATAAASKLLLKADEFEQRYKRIVWKISTETRQEEACRSQKDLLRSIEEDAFSLLKELGAPPPRRIQLGSHKTIMKQLQSLKNNVDDVIETRLDFYVERIVRALEDASTEDSSTVRGSLAALTALGLAGTRAADSIARCSGIRALLTSLMSANRLSSEFRAAALRALASVCCSALAIERFVKDGGAEILSDLLATRSSPEKERMEATSLVVQITAPWTNAQGLPYLESFADSLVPSITDLGESTECGQTLLLTAAALNQISKSRRFASAILENDTVRRLLRSVKKTSGSNVWVMEQVASLVGELAKFPEARPHLARAKASVALVCFLRMRPPGVEDAYKRLEATAAAALTRMCVDPEIAKQVVAVGGADCLPTYYDTGSELAEQTDAAGLLKYTKSLRRACKKASKHIDSAKASDYSPLS